MENILTLAKQFIAIPSTGDNLMALEEIVKLAADQLTDFTKETFVVEGKPSLLFHNAKPGTKQFKIILNAHLDVVPGKEEQFVPKIKDMRLYGRGAFDMKAASAVMIYLFKKLANEVSYPLALQIIADEELASGRGTMVQIANGIRADMVIIGECGSNLDIIYETKGLFHANLITKGTAAHGAYPWKGENAIMKMMDAINIIRKHFPTPESETYETTINISKIETTNDTWNLVPDDCTATLDIRVNRTESDTIIAKIKSILPEDATLQIEQFRAPHFTDPENKYIKMLQKSGAALTGKETTVRKTFGGSDAVFFSAEGIDAIEFGPIGQGQHHDEEWVDIKSLEDYYTILREFLLAIEEK